MPHKYDLLSILSSFLNSCPWVLTTQTRRSNDDGWIMKTIVAAMWPIVASTGAAMLGTWLTMHDSQLLMQQKMDEQSRQITLYLQKQNESMADNTSAHFKIYEKMDAIRAESQQALAHHIEVTNGNRK